MKRPKLNKTDLNEAMGTLLTGKAGVIITMSPGQWDDLLQASYDRGYTLLEIGKNEKPVAAYRMEP